MYSLSNKYLSLNISPVGAELIHLSHGEIPLIWKKNDAIWNRFAPLLFPFVGRLKNDRYLYQGQEFPMKQHGFARDKVFTLTSQNEQSLTFELKSDEHTYGIYPFKFSLGVKYELMNNQLKVELKVQNTDNKRMPFSIGAHPGFHVESEINEYSLEIPGAENWERYLIKDGLYTDEKVHMLFDTESRLRLSDEYFADDAIVFKHQGIRKVRLIKNEVPFLEFETQGEEAPYWGFWKKPDAPFLCIEPWWGIADSLNSSGNIEEKEGIRFLEPENNNTFAYLITVLK